MQLDLDGDSGNVADKVEESIILESAQVVAWMSKMGRDVGRSILSWFTH